MAEAGRGAAEDRIAELLRTWQESPSPRVGLQLAEEYRRARRHADARGVLERSLESHPGHLSSLVALGKSLLDLAEPAAAAGHFETVLERDPTHLVAGKLLIEAHLRRGDPAGARQRLEHYRLLNAGDPELEELERRTADLEGEGEPVAGAATEAGAAEAETGAAGEREAAPGGAGEPVAPGESAAAAGSGAAAPAAAEVRRPEPPAGAAGAVPPAEPGAGDPFGPLAGAGDERRWLAGLAASGIFPLELPPEPEPPPAAAEPPSAEPVEEPAPEVAPPAAEPEEAPVPAAVEAGEREPSPAAPAAESGERATRPAAPVERAAPAPVRAVAESAAPAAESGERATNTLGELYLAQGHLDDAERVFRAVLARRPEDAAAHAGLAEAARRRRGPFDAGALMRWSADRGRPVTGGDRTARSAALLRAYLLRLHRENRRDVS